MGERRHPRNPARIDAQRLPVGAGRALRAVALVALAAVLTHPDSGAHDIDPIRTIPVYVEVDTDRVALGKALFHDPRLSRDDTVACSTCHELSTGGDDGRATSVGVAGETVSLNTPTVYNAALNFRQSWDGRASTLEQEIDDMVLSPKMMGSLWPEVLAKLYRDPRYPEQFSGIYSNGITRHNIRDAVAEYLRSLITPNSRFDLWLNGDEDAITEREKRGYALFKEYGCISCHQGANVGGNMFQVFGVINEYFKRRGNITEYDQGRYRITGNPGDWHVFKVPGLRMARYTAPYLHDGSAATLRDAVDAMFEFQLGRSAPDEDKEAIIAFIESLAPEIEEVLQ